MKLKPKHLCYFVLVVSGFILGFSIRNFKQSNPAIHDYALLILSTVLTVTLYLSLNLFEQEGEATIA